MPLAMPETTSAHFPPTCLAFPCSPRGLRARTEAGVPLLTSIHEDEGDALVLIVLFLDTRGGVQAPPRAVLHDRASRGDSIALSALAGRKPMGSNYFRECVLGPTLNISETFPSQICITVQVHPLRLGAPRATWVGSHRRRRRAHRVNRGRRERMPPNWGQTKRITDLAQ